MPLYCWKFLIPPRTSRTVETYPDGSVMQAEGCLAVALAETEKDAREVLEKAAEFYGEDIRWLQVATVTRLDIDTPKMIAWAVL